MYIQLPGSWVTHSFVRNSFLIRDSTQLEKLARCGLDEVIYHPTKSLVRPEIRKKPNYIPKKKSGKTWEKPLMPEGFEEILHNTSIPPRRKASFIYDTSLDVMDKLLQSPTVENLTQFKEGVSEMVDHILVDTETSNQLLKITNHDYYTYTHSVNVGVFSVLLAKALYGVSSAHDMRELGAAFFLHDLGKVNVPDRVINKPGRLNEKEMEIMRDHPLDGYQILSDTDQLSPECKIIVMQHHERDDGSGYPLGLHGDEIHVYGRICSIADVFDALTSKRPYKKPMSLFDALLLMKGEMKNHFHPEIFSEFVQLFRR
jgi:HD-GYP domain-containing protein (c-di-GMP phosphodiesterase class II)